MVTFVLALVLVYRRGQRIVGGRFQASDCFFGFFDQTKLKNQKRVLHADLRFSYD